MSNLSLAECQAIQHIWKDMDFWCGNKVYAGIQKAVFVKEGKNYCTVIDLNEGFDFSCSKEDLTFIPDTKLMLEVLIKHNQYIQFNMHGKNKIAMFDVKTNQGRVFEGNIDKALQQCIVFLLKEGLMEAK